MCLLSFTDSHSCIIVAVSSRILNKNSQKLLLSQAPSRLQSRRRHHRRICKRVRATDFTLQIFKTNVFLNVLMVRVTDIDTTGNMCT